MEQFFKELYTLEDFRIRRAIKPSDAVGDPTLIIFSDGSKHAYGAVAYDVLGDTKKRMGFLSNIVTSFEGSGNGSSSQIF